MKYRQLIPPVMIATTFALSCSKEKEHAKAPEQTMYPAALEEEEYAEPGMPATPAAAAAAAPLALAEARCAREQRCNNIGPDKRYPTPSACLEAVKAEWQLELSARECPKGVDDDDLAECVAQVRDQDCGSPASSLERLSECTVSDICEE
jgi:hypothetical protein